MVLGTEVTAAVRKLPTIPPVESCSVSQTIQVLVSCTVMEHGVHRVFDMVRDIWTTIWIR